MEKLIAYWITLVSALVILIVSDLVFLKYTREFYRRHEFFCEMVRGYLGVVVIWALYLEGILGLG